MEWAFYVLPWWIERIEAGATTRIGDRDAPILEAAGDLVRPALALEYGWRIKHAANRAEKERIWSLMDQDMKSRIKDLERGRAI